MANDFMRIKGVVFKDEMAKRARNYLFPVVLSCSSISSYRNVMLNVDDIECIIRIFSFIDRQFSLFISFLWFWMENPKKYSLWCFAEMIIIGWWKENKSTFFARNAFHLKLFKNLIYWLRRCWIVSSRIIIP